MNNNKEIQLHKQLPLELFEAILSNLDNNDIRSAATLNRFWNKKTIHVLKNQEFYKISQFAHFFANTISIEFQQVKDELLNLIPSRDIDNSFPIPLIKIMMKNYKSELKNILLQLPNVILDNSFDALPNKKNKLFYKFVFLSEKYKSLLNELHKIAASEDRDKDSKFKALLNAGAIPTGETLDLVVQNFLFNKDILEVLFAHRALTPTATTLKLAYRPHGSWFDYDRNILTLIKAGAKPTADTINHAIQNGMNIKALLNAGAVPTETTLRLALNKGYGIKKLLKLANLSREVLLSLLKIAEGCSHFAHGESNIELLKMYLK